MTTTNHADAARLIIKELKKLYAVKNQLELLNVQRSPNAQIKARQLAANNLMRRVSLENTLMYLGGEFYDEFTRELSILLKMLPSNNLQNNKN